jgi:hypothetical protein
MAGCYGYDAFGRMQEMVYPNWMRNDWTFVPGPGEKVTYRYDRGGLLDSITGHHQTPNPEQERHPVDFTYLNHIGYDELSRGEPAGLAGGAPSREGLGTLRGFPCQSNNARS